jgi:hypothetical protein
MRLDSVNYGVTGNPIYVWNAFLTARSEGVPLPDWVLDYLERAAEGLMQLFTNPPENPGTATLEALELHRMGPSAFRSFKDNPRPLRYVSAVFKRRALGTKTGDAIKEAAKEMRVSEPTIRRAWRAYCQSVAKTVTVKT